jgi:integrase
MTKQMKTWGEALDFTWNTKWKRQRAAKTAAINAAHVTEYGGKSLPLKRMATAGWWMTFQSELLDQNRSGGGVNRIISAGTTVMKYTRLAGLHEHDCPKFSRCKENEARRTWFSKEDVDRLAFIARDLYGDRWGNDMADAILVSAYTGVRQGELLKLRPTDYNESLDALIVGGQKFNVTKPGKVRQLQLNDKIRPIIKRRLGQSRLFSADWNNKDQLYSAFKKVRRESGFTEDYVWHSLRHSFGTWLGAVTHPRTVMELLGHSTIEMSLAYCKATDESTRSAMLAL